MSSKGIWLTVLMRSAQFNSLTHFDVAQQPLLLHIPCYKIGLAVSSTDLRRDQQNVNVHYLCS
jgi:hypothetical protein